MIQDARSAPFTLREYLAFAVGSDMQHPHSSQRGVWHREHGWVTPRTLLEQLTASELDQRITVRRVDTEYHLFVEGRAFPVARLRVGNGFVPDRQAS